MIGSRRIISSIICLLNGRDMKINILYTLIDRPWGGANQFLKALRKEFESMGVYETDPLRADVVIVNSHHFKFGKKPFVIPDILREKTIVHRIDGPSILATGSFREIDRVIYYFNDKFAHGIVFQSSWSRQKSLENGIRQKEYEAVIPNAVDNAVFFPKSSDVQPEPGNPIRIVATSWSTNPRKGFDIYRYLDNHLDFSRFSVTFIGNSPIQFTNIRHIPSLNSTLLAEKLREHDIYLTASRNDPCSNSLIEALHCGLPAVALRSGGHPELVGDSGVTFEGEHDVITAIEHVSSNLDAFCITDSLEDISEIADRYIDFCKTVHENKSGNNTSALDFTVFLWLYNKMVYTEVLRSRVNQVKSISRLIVKKMFGKKTSD